MKPKYQHDCDKCLMVGQLNDGDRMHDLYICGSLPGLVDIIAREGDDGPQYRSMSGAWGWEMNHAKPPYAGYREIVQFADMNSNEKVYFSCCEYSAPIACAWELWKQQILSELNWNNYGISMVQFPVDMSR